ncbi:hypothetical protein [Kribbella catacumbae]|nr:hypothetical protein [Kribbella catacumbae]
MKRLPRESTFDSGSLARIGFSAFAYTLFSTTNRDAPRDIVPYWPMPSR